jgi:hypothetical protein
MLLSDPSLSSDVWPALSRRTLILLHCLAKIRAKLLTVWKSDVQSGRFLSASRKFACIGLTQRGVPDRLLISCPGGQVEVGAAVLGEVGIGIGIGIGVGVGVGRAVGVAFDGRGALVLSGGGMIVGAEATADIQDNTSGGKGGLLQPNNCLSHCRTYSAACAKLEAGVAFRLLPAFLNDLRYDLSVRSSEHTWKISGRTTQCHVMLAVRCTSS